MSALPEGVTYCAASHCPRCGRWTKHKPHGGPQKRHACWLRWLSRVRWQARVNGWEEGYEFGVADERRDWEGDK